MFGSRFESETIDCVASHPVSISQVVTEGMSQVIIVSDVRQHGHDPLEAAVDEGAGPRNNITPPSVAVILLFRVTAIESIIQVEQVQLVCDV